MVKFNIGHHSVQKRVHYNKDESSLRAKKFLDKIIFPVSLIGPLMMIPQIVKIYVSHDSSNLAFTSWFLFVIVSAVWIAYGVIHKEKVIVFANVAWVIAYVFMLLSIFIF